MFSDFVVGGFAVDVVVVVVAVVVFCLVVSQVASTKR